VVVGGGAVVVGGRVVVVGATVVVGAAVVVGGRVVVVGAAVVVGGRVVVVGATVVVGGVAVQNDLGRPCGTYSRLRVVPVLFQPSRHTVGTVHAPTDTPVGVTTRWMTVPVTVYSSQQSVAAACTAPVAELAMANVVALRATTRPAISHLDGPRERVRGDGWRTGADEMRGASCMRGTSFWEALLAETADNNATSSPDHVKSR
jgi:hypothetical protein